MSLKLLMDEQVAIAITLGLQERSVDVIRVQDVNLTATDDEIILDRARFLGRVVFTMDNDFLKIGATRQRAGAPFLGVIYTKQDTLSIGECIDELELLAGAYDPVDMINKVEYLPIK